MEPTVPIAPVAQPTTSRESLPVTSAGRLPSLDGWRALSILLVLGSHEVSATGFPKALDSTFGWLFDGNLGVRFFFTLSGFLITWLLLREFKTTQDISLTNFYIRRCLRILPVYFAFLTTVYLLQRYVGNVQNRHSWAACLTFTRNTFGGDPVSAHLWSLSVEEQFYLLWPTLLVLLLTRTNTRTLIGTLVLILLLAPVCRGAIEAGFCPQYPAARWPETSMADLGAFALIMAARFFSCADALAFGCLAAVLLAYQARHVWTRLATRPSQTAAIAVACILLPYIFNRLVIKAPVICVQFANSLQAFGFVLLLLQSILLPEAGLYRALNCKPAVQIGILSYSIYIWQQLIWSAPQSLGLAQFWWLGLWILPLLAIAATSYYAFELPVTRLRNAFRPKPAFQNSTPKKECFGA